MSELWTAKRKEFDEQGWEFIVFEVKDEDTGEIRDEKRDVSALPVIFAMGGWPPSFGALMKLEELPWRFRKVAETIVGVDDHDSIG